LGQPSCFVRSLGGSEGLQLSTVFVFPGQGSQSVGMGKALAENFPGAREVFREVDDALATPLSRLMWDGPEAELTLTENAQPALMAVSMAVMRVLAAEHGISVGKAAKFVAGHSLGEYSALAAAGTFALADAARLLRIRGQAMQAATPVGTGAMAALLGLDFAAAVEVAHAATQGEVCEAANDNAAGQVVVSGHKAAVERALGIAKERGAARAVLLPVSAPFHCSLMQPAAERMAAALAEVAMQAPAVPVVANVIAAPVSDPASIRQRLIEQVTSTVRWRETMAFFASQGVTTIVEAGAGKVLSGLARRGVPGAVALAVSTPEDIAAAAAKLNKE
jgi:[acyl-carrier-protein] S-malonyltransferase